MRFYCYKGDHELGKEPLGSADRMIWRDLKTIQGAVRRATRLWGAGGFRLFSFTNFFDDRTFKEVK